MTLDPVQLRVLGALIEKEITTPEYYPLSLNSLIAACNQKSSRDPVMELREDDVLRALDSLEDLGITAVSRDSRVPKYEHRIRTILNLRRDETAILCLLLLRGPQTAGELRARADRLYSFDGIESVESTLSRMSSQPPDELVKEQRPLVEQLPRQPGSREARYTHLIGGPVEAAANASRSSAREAEMEEELATRLTRLEGEVALLKAEVAKLNDVLGAAGLLQDTVAGKTIDE